MADHDERFMRAALRLARRGEGRVEPNPMVGCVIARSDRIVGEGWHRRYGQAHAEVNALAAAGGAAKGATVYVSLEPCCHFGKTPPCADTLIKAGVKRVVIGCVDPSAKVSGRGIRKLRDAGIEVTVGVLEAPARRIIEPWARREATGLPWVIAKWAQTVDGAIATGAGDSQWISSEASRRIVHQLRARVDAVMVGIGTALADDPMLTARDVPLRRMARRVVIDPRLRLPRDSALVRSADQAPVTIATARGSLDRRKRHAAALERAGVEVVGIGSVGNETGAPASRSNGAPGPGAARAPLDASVLLRYLVEQHDATNVLVEGGGATLGALADQNLLNELLIFVGPKLLGDRRAVRPIKGTKLIGRIADGRDVELTKVRRVGGDVMMRYRVGGGA